MAESAKVIILGSGPAGLTSAIYAARANLHPIVIEGKEPGGQLMTTTEVQNYPGFPEGVLGPDLMNRMRAQAEVFGATFVKGDATAVDLSRRPFEVRVQDDVYYGETLIVATGASPKRLGLENEQSLIGRGVSYCATCDAYFFRGGEVVVVGGGDTALEEAIYLAKFAKSVKVVHRRDQFRASKYMQKRLFDTPNIQVIWDSVVEEIMAEDEEVSGIKIRNVRTGEIRTLPCDGLFVAIGHTPNSELFRDQLELMDNGYIHTTGSGYTNVEGVFAAGDVQDHIFRQAVTSAASGCKAAMLAERYLNL